MKLKMKKKIKKDNKNEKKIEILEGIERLQVGDIVLTSGIFTVYQLTTVLDNLLKKKRIIEYLEIYRNKKMLNGNSYLG